MTNSSTTAKAAASTNSTLSEAVRSGVETSNQLLESSLFRGIIDRERNAATDEIGLLESQIEGLTFRKRDLEKIVESANAAIAALGSNGEHIE